MFCLLFISFFKRSPIKILKPLKFSVPIMLLNLFRLLYKTYGSPMASSTKPCVLTTSEHNGVAECKHYHLLDITCSLLVEMRVPHFLWSNSLFTSAYLLNCLPLSPLCGEVPFCRLHHDCDLFVLPHQVFGCVAYAHDHTPNTSKLAPAQSKGCSSATRA